jgi:hypothetical protein
MVPLPSRGWDLVAFDGEVDFRARARRAAVLTHQPGKHRAAEVLAEAVGKRLIHPLEGKAVGASGVVVVQEGTRSVFFVHAHRDAVRQRGTHHYRPGRQIRVNDPRPVPARDEPTMKKWGWQPKKCKQTDPIGVDPNGL